MSIYKRESFPDFLKRVIDLNAVHAGDDELHAALVDDADDGPGKQARKKLVTIHHDFPYGAPLEEQAAYLLRAFHGLAPFGVADHRTGWDYLSELLTHAGHTIEASQKEVQDLGLALFERLQDSHPDGFDRRHVLDRDDTLAWLTSWFHHRLA